MIIKAVVSAFEGGDAVLTTEEDSRILLPLGLLATAKIGDRLRLAISSDGDTKGADKEIARDILNEILDTGPNEQL